ncbi:MAG: NusG domain II-containing protein [Bacillota bacterium]
MKYLRKMDLILIAVIAVLALGFWLANRFFFMEKGTYAEIYRNSRLVFRVKLSTAKEGSFSIPGEPNVVLHIYSDRSIAFIKSDCPNKLCIRSGRLKDAGQFAACLPNKIMLKIVSDEKDREGPDLIIK